MKHRATEEKSNKTTTPMETDAAIEIGHTVADKSESKCRFLFQVISCLLLAGMGLWGAGAWLFHIKEWEVFEEVHAIWILIPPLLGLKGNLEMTFGSRLSTSSNLARLSDTSYTVGFVGTNLILVQIQALVVSTAATVCALFVDALFHTKLVGSQFSLLLAVTPLTALIAVCIVSSVMSVMILLAPKCNVNPDNYVAPLAASMGDLFTVLLLSYFASILYTTSVYIHIVIIIACLSFIPLGYFLIRDRMQVFFHENVLKTGWTPIILSMILSSCGGAVFEVFVSTYPNISSVLPLFNGIGGAISSIYGKRLTTIVHSQSHHDDTIFDDASAEDAYSLLPHNTSSTTRNLQQPHAFWYLLLLTAPVHLFFLFLFRALPVGLHDLTVLFVVLYLLFAVCQVALLLVCAGKLVTFFSRQSLDKCDPDNHVLPYLNALGDLCGSLFIVIVFLFLDACHDKLAVKE